MNAWLTPALHLPSAVLPQEERGGRGWERGSLESATGVVHILGGRRTIDREIERLRRSLPLSLSLISVKEQVNCTDVPPRPLPPSPPLLRCIALISSKEAFPGRRVAVIAPRRSLEFPSPDIGWRLPWRLRDP